LKLLDIGGRMKQVAYLSSTSDQRNKDMTLARTNTWHWWPGTVTPCHVFVSLVACWGPWPIRDLFIRLSCSIRLSVSFVFLCVWLTCFITHCHVFQVVSLVMTPCHVKERYAACFIRLSFSFIFLCLCLTCFIRLRPARIRDLFHSSCDLFHRLGMEKLHSRRHELIFCLVHLNLGPSLFGNKLGFNEQGKRSVRGV